MKIIKFIWIGKLKAGHFRDAAAHYLKLIRRFNRVEEITVKDAPGKLPPNQRVLAEGRAVLARLGPADLPVCLDEHGENPDSVEFSGRLAAWIEDPVKTPCFIVGGAYGLSGEVLERCGFKLGLGRLTLPHELARVVLLEQVYRALTISAKTPYHH